MPPRSLRKKAAPSICCLPPADSGPVLTVRNPTLSGSCACENARRDGSTPSAAAPTSNVRREIASLPFLRGILELHEIFLAVLASGRRTGMMSRFNPPDKPTRAGDRGPPEPRLVVPNLCERVTRVFPPRHVGGQ